MNKVSSKEAVLMADIGLAHKYMSRDQFWVMMEALKGENGQYFMGLFRDVAQAVRIMPEEIPLGLRDRQIAHLHYFGGGSNWYILSKGTKENPYPHGFAILNDDGWNAEYGDLSIKEITSAGAELDLYWEPKPMYEIKKQHGIEVESPEELLDLENEKLVQLLAGRRQYDVLSKKMPESFRFLRDKVATNIRAMPRTPPGGPHENHTAFLRFIREEYNRRTPNDKKSRGDHPAKLVSWYVMSSGDGGKYPLPYCLAVTHDNPRGSRLGFVSLDEITWEGVGVPPAVIDLNYRPEKLKDIEARYGITHLKGRGVSIQESIGPRIEDLDGEPDEDLEPEVER